MTRSHPQQARPRLATESAADGGRVVRERRRWYQYVMREPRPSGRGSACASIPTTWAGRKWALRAWVRVTLSPLPQGPWDQGRGRGVEAEGQGRGSPEAARQGC